MELVAKFVTQVTRTAWYHGEHALLLQLDFVSVFDIIYHGA